MAIRRALISVFDKEEILPFARQLALQGIEILSTGGTATVLSDAGISVSDVANYTGFPEMMTGRLKTLHPKVHGALLGLRDSEEHIKAMKEHDIRAIDLLVVNLYPFESVISGNPSEHEAIENIDIGGPAMIRSAAKNYSSVTVVVDPADYPLVLSELLQHQGTTTLNTRRRLATKAFSKTAAYDSVIAEWFARQADISFPQTITFSATLREALRYGENPQQEAAIYESTGPKREGVLTATQIQGKPLSFNNINDADAAFELIADLRPLEKPAVAIIKHSNPCGVALGDSIEEAYKKALACDRLSAFGGIVAVNRIIDTATAKAISDTFAEVIIAPDIDSGAQSLLEKKKALRVLIIEKPDKEADHGYSVRSVAGGYLVQTRDHDQLNAEKLETVTKRSPTAQETRDMLFAFIVAKHVKSNAIVFAKNEATVGIGAGQMSRLDSALVAIQKAKAAADREEFPTNPITNSVLASDAFFPFSDGLLAGIEAGATAVIQPGGSVKDEEVIAAANKSGISMIFTGIRHFRH